MDKVFHALCPRANLRFVRVLRTRDRIVRSKRLFIHSLLKRRTGKQAGNGDFGGDLKYAFCDGGLLFVGFNPGSENLRFGSRRIPENLLEPLQRPICLRQNTNMLS